MSSEWPLVRLGDLISLKGGFAYKGEFLGLSGAVLLGMGVVSHSERFLKDGIRRYSGELPSAHRVSAGDMVIATRQQSDNLPILGCPALVPKDLPSDDIVVGTNLYKVTNTSDLENQFLYWLLRGKEYRRRIIDCSKGTTVRMITKDAIEDFCFLYPPLETRNEITGFLDALDERITLLRETNSTLEAIAQAMFKSWFVDFDPVRAKIEGKLPEGMDEATAALFPDAFEETELGVVPRGWRVEALDDVADFLNGLALQKFPPTGFDDLPVIKIAQLRKGDTAGADLASGSIKPEYIIRNGDVLFSWSGSLEVEIWCGGVGALNQHLFKVSSSRFEKWFYYLWTRHHLESFRQIAASKATTMGHIQRGHLSSAKVNVPTDSVLKVADAVFTPIVERIVQNALQANTLATLRDTLLPRLISGRLSIAKAEAELEKVAA